MTVWMISAILIVTLYLLITERIPVDLTAIGIMVVLVVFGILSPKEAVMGLAHPAVVTVGAMFVISKGMMRTGAVESLGRYVIRFSRGNRYFYRNRYPGPSQPARIYPSFPFQDGPLSLSAF